MRYLRTLFLMLAALVVQNNLSAQTSDNNHNGDYIVMHNGDTVYGYIINRLTNIDPTYVTFRKNQQEQEQNLTPKDIKAYRYQNTIYELWTVKVDPTPLRTDLLTRENNPDFEQATLFLAAIFTGPKKLYYIPDYGGRKQFFIGTDSVPSLLVYKRYIKMVDNSIELREVVVDNKVYVGQLKLYFQDCPDIFGKIEKSDYDPEDMMRLFKEYYACKNIAIDNPGNMVPSASKRNTNKVYTKVHFSLIGGASLTPPRFNLGPTGRGQTVTFKANNKPIYGISIGLQFPMDRARWTLSLERLFKQLDTEFYSLFFKNDSNYTETSYASSGRRGYINLRVGYEYPINNNSSLRFGIGRAYGWGGKTKNYSYTKVETYNGVPYTLKPVYPAPYALGDAWFCDIGYSYKRWMILSRYSIYRTYKPGVSIIQNKLVAMVRFRLFTFQKKSNIPE